MKLVLLVVTVLTVFTADSRDIPGKPEHNLHSPDDLISSNEDGLFPDQTLGRDLQSELKTGHVLIADENQGYNISEEHPPFPEEREGENEENKHDGLFPDQTLGRDLQSELKTGSVLIADEYQGYNISGEHPPFPEEREGQNEENKLAQGLNYTEGTRYEEIWNDKGSGGWQDVSIWRPSHLASGYCSLGDVAHREYYEPSFKSVSVSGIGVVHPDSFSQVWNDKGSGARLDCAVYKMNAPSGHTCLGGVAMRSHHHQPDRNRYCCIRNDLILNGNAHELYKDRGTGANEDLSLWRITKGTDPNGIDANNFLPVKGYGSPSNPKVLNGQTATKA